MKTLKCISLWQPWATLCVIGAKPIETRHWPINYRGELGMHAAKRKDPVARDLYSKPPFTNYCTTPFDDLPFGVIIGTINIVDCISTNDVNKLADALEKLSIESTSAYIQTIKALGQKPNEESIILDRFQHIKAFGDFSPNRYAWIIGGYKLFDKAIECRGAQGFFNAQIPEHD
jgi:hypothetical protein